MRSLLLLLAAGCGVFTGTHGNPNPNTTNQDIAQYDALEMQLAGNASVLVPASHQPSSPTGIGNYLYYLEFPANNPTVPTLHRFDDTAGKTTDYGFSIGTTDPQTPYNWNASGTLVTTVDPAGSSPVLNAYNAGAANAPIGSLALPAPLDGAIFQANAVDGTSAYYIDDAAQPVTLDEWAPGQASGTAVLDFSKVGVDARNAQGFAVSGTRLLLQDQMGGLWVIDIPTQSGKWIGNMTQGTGLLFDSSGFLYSTAANPSAGLYYYEFSSGKTVDVAGAIAASSYKLNDTYSTVHYYSSGGALQNGSVFYVSESSSVYRFDLSSNKVTPILLAPRDDSTQYQSPTVLDDGTLIVLGLDTQVAGGATTIYKVAH